MRTHFEMEDDEDFQCSPTTANDRIVAHIDDLLTANHSGPVDWNVVSGLLQQCLTPVDDSASSSAAAKYASTQDDPMGRLFVTAILSRGPPADIVETAIRIFPYSLDHNPVAFLAASQNAGPEVLTRMAQHVSGGDEEQCPYPWLLSENISVEQAKIILEAFPQGVLKPSPFLSSYNLIDYLLMVVKSRSFDLLLWTKFKLVLVAVGCSDGTICSAHNGEIAPLQVILKRVLSRSDFWTNQDQLEHVLWLLHQLRWTDCWVFKKQSRDGGFPIHFVLSHKCTSDQSGLVAARALTQLLLEAHPESASQSVKGKLALHMAIENGWPCHDLLLSVNPEALDTPDPTTELFPFQAAAKYHHTTASSISLDVTYELLRANPNHATSMHRDEVRGVWAQA